MSLPPEARPSFTEQFGPGMPIESADAPSGSAAPSIPPGVVQQFSTAAPLRYTEQFGPGMPIESAPKPLSDPVAPADSFIVPAAPPPSIDTLVGEANQFEVPALPVSPPKAVPDAECSANHFVLSKTHPLRVLFGIPDENFFGKDYICFSRKSGIEFIQSFRKRRNMPPLGPDELNKLLDECQNIEDYANCMSDLQTLQAALQNAESIADVSAQAMTTMEDLTAPEDRKIEAAAEIAIEESPNITPAMVQATQPATISVDSRLLDAAKKNMEALPGVAGASGADICRNQTEDRCDKNFCDFIDGLCVMKCDKLFNETDCNRADKCAWDENMCMDKSEYEAKKAALAEAAAEAKQKADEAEQHAEELRKAQMEADDERRAAQEKEDQAENEAAEAALLAEQAAQANAEAQQQVESAEAEYQQEQNEADSAAAQAQANPEDEQARADADRQAQEAQQAAIQLEEQRERARAAERLQEEAGQAAQVIDNLVDEFQFGPSAAPTSAATSAQGSRRFTVDPNAPTSLPPTSAGATSAQGTVNATASGPPTTSAGATSAQGTVNATASGLPPTADQPVNCAGKTAVECDDPCVFDYDQGKCYDPKTPKLSAAKPVTLAPDQQVCPEGEFYNPASKKCEKAPVIPGLPPGIFTTPPGAAAGTMGQSAATGTMGQVTQSDTEASGLPPQMDNIPPGQATAGTSAQVPQQSAAALGQPVVATQTSDVIPQETIRIGAVRIRPDRPAPVAPVEAGDISVRTRWGRYKLWDEKYERGIVLSDHAPLIWADSNGNRYATWNVMYRMQFYPDATPTPYLNAQFNNIEMGNREVIIRNEPNARDQRINPTGMNEIAAAAALPPAAPSSAAQLIPQYSGTSSKMKANQASLKDYLKPPVVDRNRILPRSAPAAMVQATPAAGGGQVGGASGAAIPLESEQDHEERKQVQAEYIKSLIDSGVKAVFVQEADRELYAKLSAAGVTTAYCKNSPGCDDLMIVLSPALAARNPVDQSFADSNVQVLDTDDNLLVNFHADFTTINGDPNYIQKTITDITNQIQMGNKQGIGAGDFNKPIRELQQQISEDNPNAIKFITNSGKGYAGAAGGVRHETPIDGFITFIATDSEKAEELEKQAGCAKHRTNDFCNLDKDCLYNDVDKKCEPKGDVGVPMIEEEKKEAQEKKCTKHRTKLWCNRDKDCVYDDINRICKPKTAEQQQAAQEQKQEGCAKHRDKFFCNRDKNCIYDDNNRVCKAKSTDDEQAKEKKGILKPEKKYQPLGNVLAQRARDRRAQQPQPGRDQFGRLFPGAVRRDDLRWRQNQEDRRRAEARRKREDELARRDRALRDRLNADRQKQREFDQQFRGNQLRRELGLPRQAKGFDNRLGQQRGQPRENWLQKLFGGKDDRAPGKLGAALAAPLAAQRAAAARPLDFRGAAAKPLDFRGADGPLNFRGAAADRPGFLEGLKKWFGARDQKNVGELVARAMEKPDAFRATQRNIVTLERKTLEELIAAIAKLASHIGAEKAARILRQTHDRLLDEADKMCLANGWSLFDEVAGHCLPVIDSQPAAERRLPPVFPERAPNKLTSLPAVQVRPPIAGARPAAAPGNAAQNPRAQFDAIRARLNAQKNNFAGTVERK